MRLVGFRVRAKARPGMTAFSAAAWPRQLGIEGWQENRRSSVVDLTAARIEAQKTMLNR
jgi:hypothetical protein